MMYRSAKLEQLWSVGFSAVSDVTFESAAYVARYCMKKLDDGPILEKRFELDGVLYDVVERTGELRLPEFVRMSRGCKKLGTGGIGRGFYDKFKLDMYPQDYVIMRGMKMLPPRFYDGRFELEDADGFRDVRNLRSARCRRFSEDVLDGRTILVPEDSPSRLAVREEVVKSKVKLLRRSMEV